MRDYESTTTFVVSLTPPVLPSQPPSAEELLRRCGANFDRQTSFIAKWESCRVGSHNLRKETINEKGEMSFSAGEICYDGYRKAERTYAWGKINEAPAIPSREQGLYDSRMWDGVAYYQYQRWGYQIGGETDRGRLSRVRTQTLDKLARWFRSGGRVVDLKPGESHNYYYRLSQPEFGYFKDDLERLDRVLLEQSESLSVRPKTDKVNGADCYVIDAATRRGRYTVWIDPRHGYQTARVTVARRTGDEALCVVGFLVPPKGKIDTTIDYLRFRNIGGVWVAVETRTQYHRDFGFDNKYCRYRTHLRITSVQLNPDHEALRSFVPHDVPDGAFVQDTEWSGKEGAGQLVWRNGKPVPAPGSWASYMKGHSRRATTRVGTRASAAPCRPSASAAEMKARPAAREVTRVVAFGKRQAPREKASPSHPRNVQVE